jgi:hypothetical protein
MRGSVRRYAIITSPSHKASYSGVYILSFGRRYVVDSIDVVEMCCNILSEHKYILFKE